MVGNTKNTINSDNVVKSIKNHLRHISRKVLKFNEKEEILSFTMKTLSNRLNSDFVIIALKEGNDLKLASYLGELPGVENLFPYPFSEVNTKLFENSLINPEENLDMDSPLSNYFQTQQKGSWFTLPIKDEDEVLGFGIVGYNSEEILYSDVEDSFNDLGNYLAIALNLIRENEIKDKKIKSLQWMSQHLNYEISIKPLIKRIVTLLGRQTNSNYIAIYLLDKNKEVLSMQKPTYGYCRKDEIIFLKDGELIENYLPYVEEVGHNQISMPIMINDEVVGVMHAEKKESAIYTGHDLDLFDMYTNYFSAMLENAMLSNKEKQKTQSLENILDIQQKFIKVTIEESDFSSLNQIISETLSTNIILYDRFMNLIDYYFIDNIDSNEEEIKQAGERVKNNENLNKHGFIFELFENRYFHLFSVNNGEDVFGFLAIELYERENLYDSELIHLNMALNIYALQFTKKQIEFNAKQQIKQSFVEQLLSENIKNYDSLNEYGNLFNWDLNEPCRIAVIKISNSNIENEISENIFNEQKEITFQLDQINTIIKKFDSKVNSIIINNKLILFNTVKNEKYWKGLHNYLSKNMAKISFNSKYILGIGGITTKPDDYFESYQKAVQTVNILQNNKYQSNWAYFDTLGPYILLDKIKGLPETDTFIKNQLVQLYEASKGQKVDLYHTLRVYLNNQGNLTDTADELFLHRSTLQYRLDKVKNLINIDLDDPDARFNLQLAYKLDDLY